MYIYICIICICQKMAMWIYEKWWSTTGPPQKKTWQSPQILRTWHLTPPSWKMPKVGGSTWCSGGYSRLIPSIPHGSINLHGLHEFGDNPYNSVYIDIHKLEMGFTPFTPLTMPKLVTFGSPSHVGEVETSWQILKRNPWYPLLVINPT